MAVLPSIGDKSGKWTRNGKAAKPDLNGAIFDVRWHIFEAFSGTSYIVSAKPRSKLIPMIKMKGRIPPQVREAACEKKDESN